MRFENCAVGIIGRDVSNDQGYRRPYQRLRRFARDGGVVVDGWLDVHLGVRSACPTCSTGSGQVQWHCQALRGELRDNPPSPDEPWRVVLGFDEHTPGSKGEPVAGGGAAGDPAADGGAAGDPAAATADWLATVDL